MELSQRRVLSWQRMVFTILAAGIGFLILAPSLNTSALGQVVTSITPTTGAGQLGTTISQAGSIYNITGGTRAGTNLFHSFGNFSVGAPDTANFLNTPVNGSLPLTSNILGRVTGGNSSNIFGTIQTTGFGNANLFLMNPAGFLFGPNATVNVGGMVAFTTADYLRLQEIGGGNAGIFHADPAQLSVLTAAPVAAFGFLGSNPGAITVQGSQLSVTPEQNISLVGGNITAQAGTLDDGTTVQPARLSAPGGQINLASVASPGEILLPNLQYAPNINGQSFTTMGNINLSQGSLLNVSADAAGTVRIRGGQLVMNDATISADTNNTNGAPTAVDINVTGDMTIADTRGLPAITARTTGTGDAGAIQIVSGNLTATSNFLDPNFLPTTLIDSHTEGDGRGGDVRITTGNFVAAGTGDLQGSNGFMVIDSGPRANGRGGDVTINAQTVDLNSTSISTGQFVASSLVPDLSTVNGSGGNLTITANTLKTMDSVFDTSALFGAFFGGSIPQTGGDITITARDISMVNTQVGSINLSGGGALTIKANSLVASFTSFDMETVDGPGGGITFQGGVLELTNGSPMISSTVGTGNAGDIRITATDHVSLVGDNGTNFLAPFQPSGLFSNSFGNIFGSFGGPGNAGNISVTTPTLNMVGGRINTVTSSGGAGGNVTLNVSNAINISGEFPRDANLIPSILTNGPVAPSGITTETVGDPSCGSSCGNAGNITINTGSLTLGNGGQINSGTGGSGQGGNITINASGPISISGTLSDGTPVGIFSRAIGTDPGSGSGGNILLKTNSVTIQNGGQLSAITLGPGAAGNVTVEGTSSPAQSVLIDGAGSGIFTNTDGTGPGGNISISAQTFTLQNGGTLSAATSGTAPSATGGAITVDANQVQLLSGGLITAATTGPGNAGSVTINAADSITLAGQDSFALPPPSARSRITTSTSRFGDGGDVTITAGQAVSLTGNHSGIFTDTSGTGNAGNVTIAADTLTLNSRARIEASTLPGSEGRGGNIDVQVRQAALTGSSAITTNTVGLGDAGSVRIRADESIALIDFSNINSSSFDFGSGAGNAGLIWLTAPTIALEGGTLSSLSQGPGNAGNILLEARTLTVGANAAGFDSSITAETSGPGRGGDITIRGLTGPGSRASDVTVSGASTVTSTTSGDGRAGDVAVRTERLTLTDGGALMTSSGATGDAGNITVDASASVQVSSFSLLASNSDFGPGNAGQITITTPTLTVEQGGVISTSTSGTGNAGNITVNANSVSLLSGGQLTSSSLNFAPPEFPEFAPTGKAGTVTLQGLASPAQSVLIDGTGSGIFTDTQGTGAGGNIVVNANTVTLQNGGMLSAATSGTASSATGGTITVTAPGQMAMTGGSSLSASSSGPANAGDISINAGQQLTMQNSSITTEASQASGGNITIQAVELVGLETSKISASVLGGPQTTGGNITIDPNLVILQNSQITANAVQGNGGNISLTTNFLIVNNTLIGPTTPVPASAISASSQFGENGTITVQSPNAPASGKIIPLSQKPLLATSLLNQRCASLAGGEFSSFTVAGRDSLPTEPGGWLASPLALGSTGTGGGPVAENGERAGIDDDPARARTTLSLRKIAPPGFLTQAFAVEGSAGCQS